LQNSGASTESRQITDLDKLEYQTLLVVHSDSL
jgi:hypothetical protein